MFTKSYWSPGPEVPCSPVILIVRRKVLIGDFILLLGNQGHVCYPHPSDLDNSRTHQQSNLKAPWREEGQLREGSQKVEGHGIPVSWSERRKQVPRIGQGTHTYILRKHGIRHA